MKKQKTAPDVSCETFSETLRKIFSGTKVKINEEHTSKMYRFWELLLKWNSVHNLTSVTDTRRAVFTHFADSLLPLLVTDIFNKTSRVIDFGTGGGFPGIPLAIMAPETDFLLVDKMHKKISFLHFASVELSLNNVFPIHSDITSIEEKCDSVLSRAVNIDGAVLKIIQTKIKKGGCFISFLSDSQEPVKTDMECLVHKFDFLPSSGKIAVYHF